MWNATLRWLGRLLVLQAFLGVASAFGQSQPPIQWSRDRLLALSTDNMQAFSQAWNKTKPGQTAAGPGLADYRNALAREQVASVFYLRPWLGLDWNDLARVPDRTMLSVAPAGKDEVAIALWIGSTRDSAASRACQDAAIKYWKARRYTHSTERSGDTEIHRFVRSVSRSGAASVSERRVVYVTPRGIAFSTHEANLADLATGIEAPRRETGEPEEESSPVAKLMVKPFALARQTQSNRKEGRRWISMADRLGGGQLDEWRGTITLAPGDRSAIRFALRGPLSQPLQSAARMLSIPVGEQPDPLGLVSGQVDTVTTWRWNCREAMEAFGNLFDEWTEPGPDGVGLFADLVDGLRDDPEGPQVDLRRDLFSQVGPRLYAYSLTDPGSKNRRQFLIWAECSNVEPVKRTIERFFKNDRAVRSEQIAGHASWSIGPGKSLLVEVEGDNLVSVRAVAIGQRGFFVASNPELLQAILSEEQRADDAEQAQWRRLLSEAASQPGEVSGRIFSVTESRFASAYAAARQPLDENARWESSLLRKLLLGDDPQGQKIQAKDLPEFRELRGLFQPAWLTYRWQQGGMEIVGGFVEHSRGGESP